MKIQLHKLSDLIRHTLLLNDGSVATVVCVYFDDQNWTVRHFVVRMDGQHPGREVLVPPNAIQGLPHQPGSFGATLTREELESAPSADSQMPVSRHYQLQIPPQSGCPPSLSRDIGAGSVRSTDVNWFGWLPVPPQGRVFDPTIQASLPTQPDHRPETPKHPHLCSSESVRGYHLLARDGKIGHVEDFILEEPDWKVRYLEINTRNWLPGKHVLMTPAWILDVNWAMQQVEVGLDRRTIQTAPPYEPKMAISPDDEIELRDHYSASTAGG